MDSPLARSVSPTVLGRQSSPANSSVAAPFSYRRIILPGEHGSWAFVLEPLVLGLLVAFSPAAVAISIAVFCGFLTRKPFRLGFGKRQQTTATRKRARFVFLCLGGIAAGAISIALKLSAPSALVPLALAVPPLLFFARKDDEGDARSLAAEMVATGLCSLPLVSITLAANWPLSIALGVACVNLARAWPTVLFVRSRLRAAKQKQRPGLLCYVSQIAAPVALAALALSNGSPWMPVLLCSLLSLRAGYMLSARSPRLTAKQVGIIEVFVGLLCIIVCAWAYRGFVA
ncbi:MAG: YwiC-like family protein [Nibricoccus sp.]